MWGGFARTACRRVPIYCSALTTHFHGVGDGSGFADSPPTGRSRIPLRSMRATAYARRHASHKDLPWRAAEHDLSVAVGGRVPVGHDVAGHGDEVAVVALDVVVLEQAAAAGAGEQRLGRALGEQHGVALVAAAARAVLEAQHRAGLELVHGLAERALVQEVAGVDHGAR